MPAPGSTPPGANGEKKQQRLLSARVKRDRKIGEAAGRGGGAQLGNPGSVASAPTPPHPIPRPWWPRGAAIPTQHVSKGAQWGMGESPLFVTGGQEMSARGDSPGLSSQGQSGRAPSRRQLGPVCGSDGDRWVWQCVLWRWEDSPQGEIIRARHLATGVGP